MNNVTIFDRAYPMDKQAEGMAIHWAVVSGACGKCHHLSTCENFEAGSPLAFPPPGAAYAAKKDEILRQFQEEEVSP